MTVELLFELAWKSALCAGLTLLLLGALQKRSAAERSRVAHLGLLTVLLLPLTLSFAPKVEFQAPARVASLVATKAVPALATISSGQASLAPAAPAEAPLAIAADAESLTVLLAAGPALLLLLITLIAIARLQLLRGRSRVLTDAQWLTALARTQQRFGFKHGTALLVTSEICSPISWGMLRPVILLDELAAQDPGKAEAIIAHELAHVARLDWAKLLIGRLATALFWFNPLIWLLAGRCHQLREEAADDAVLRSDLGNTDYAELLVGVARHENRAILLAANGVAPSRSSLGRRVRRVLDQGNNRVPARLGWTLACCVGAFVLNAPLAALSPVNLVQASQSPIRPPAYARGPAPVPIAVPQKGSGTDVALAGQTSQSLASASQTAAVSVPAVAAPALSSDEFVSPILEEGLVEAAERGDRRTVEKLIGAGLSPNAAVPGDGTPLIAAVRSGRRDLVEYLLGQGADINLPIHGDGNPLIAAAAAGHIELVGYLLDRGADLEAIVPSDENALMQAAYWGHEDVVRLLIARGANVNSRDGSRTPLVMARLGRHKSIERILSQAGAIQ